MTSFSRWIDEDPAPPKILLKCAGIALILEVGLLTAIGWHEHWLSHPQKTTGIDESRFVEAEVFQFPEEAHLVEEKKVVTERKPEVALSKDPTRGKKTQDPNPANEEENRTDSGPKLAPNHGPVAVYAPLPVIPSYLQDQFLKGYVLIDFFVTAQGAVTPRLIGSSGNDELDAIALTTVKKWQFRPAEQDHKAVDAKARLRILFEVH